MIMLDLRAIDDLIVDKGVMATEIVLFRSFIASNPGQIIQNYLLTINFEQVTGPEENISLDNTSVQQALN